MDVEGLPTLVYLKGFLRAYAAAVQLDPEEVTTRYLGELPPAYAEREAHPPPVPTTVGAFRELHAARTWEIDDVPDVELPFTAWQPVAAPTDDRRVATARRVVSAGVRASIARYVPVVVVGVIALLVGWVIGANLHTITTRSTEPAAIPHGAERGTAASPSDGRNTQARDEVPPAVATASNTADAASVAVPAFDRATGEDRSVDAKPRAAATYDLSGSWALTNRVEPATSGAFEDLNVGFHLQLQQRGNRVSGTGQKWMENGRSLPPGSRPAIAVEGTLTGRRLELNFTERGTERSSAGKFVMNVTDEGTLRGRFVSDAANARATSLARRMARH